jgi:hypothetical protein
MPAPSYTLPVLHKAIEEGGATLIGTYESCNATTLIRFICKCGNTGEKRMRSLIDKGGPTCKSCRLEIMRQKVKATNLERYGVECALSSPEVKAKIKATNLERYGTPCPLSVPEIQEKIKSKNLEKYGVTCTIHAPAIKEKVKATNLRKFGVEHSFQAESVKRKTKETLLERYGVEHISSASVIKEKVVATNLRKHGVKYSMQSSEVREKSYATNMRKYGVRIARQADQFKEKAKQTLLTRYGVDHPMKVAEFKEKAKQTLKEHYGVEHTSQSPEIRARLIASNMVKYGVSYSCQAEAVMEKIQRNSKKYKKYQMPSGTIRNVQGYEPFALNELLQTYTEEQIKTDRRDVPRIQYEVDGMTRYYFPDIYIPHENRLIEVKSTWTYQCKENNVLQKKAACIAAGYNCEIWCYERGGKRINLSADQISHV